MFLSYSTLRRGWDSGGGQEGHGCLYGGVEDEDEVGEEIACFPACLSGSLLHLCLMH